MIDAIALRRFNNDGAEFSKDEPLSLTPGAFAELSAIGLVRKAPKSKLPAKQ
jgi:hypothetical protein